MFWKGEDLRARINYSSIDLDLCLDLGQIELELRRSLYNEMTEEELKTTILLNISTLVKFHIMLMRY